MRALVLFLLSVSLLLIADAGATIINIPDDYPTIQEGIDHGGEGDTVLVQPDIYHENLNFNGHNVLLASVYLTTGDTGYISSTIIDGSQSGSVITFTSGEQQNAQVVGFTIQNGYSSMGGGVRCIFAHPTVRDNIIRNNGTNSYGYGGGVYCEESWATITGNLIEDNSTGDNGYGGGVYCAWCTPVVSENAIVGNSADSWGGGICCVYASPTIERNLMEGNSAPWGGGILYSNSSAPSDNNTITGNSADWGGGLCCFDCAPEVRNCILWGDSAATGPEIFFEGREPAVTYCDVEGGWQGEGNIDADPLFVGPYHHDLKLRWRSPCIDAGDPSFPLDPDSTRSDMGTSYFNQDVLGAIELYPHNAPIVIPPEGGVITYDGWVFNFLGHRSRADIWTFALVPGMGRYGPINLLRQTVVPADSIGSDGITLHVPGGAPSGDYLFLAYVGYYPGTVVDSSYFYFRKTSSAQSAAGPRFESGDWCRATQDGESILPTGYALHQNIPNPFNAVTVIGYSLATTGEVKLEVLDILGRKVITLVDERQETGSRSVSWDASGVPSGVYFYRLTTGEYTEIKRMVLLK
jgi:hypothetical protein